MFDFVIFNLGYANKPKLFDANEPIELLGLRSFGGYRIASSLRNQGYRVKCIDFLFNFSEDEFKKLLSAYVSESTLAIGFSLMFGNIHDERMQDLFLSYLRIAKEQTSKKIIVGGKLRKNFKRFSELRSTADVIIYNEAERAIFKLLEDIRNNRVDLNIKLNNEVDAQTFWPNTNEDNNTLDITFTDDDDLFFGEPVSIELARGCIFNCSFCSFPLRGKTKVDYLQNSERLRRSFVENFEKFGITNYYVVDSTFNDSIEKLEHIAKVVESLPFKLNFSGYLRPELLIRKSEQIDLLARIGWVSGVFGIETLNTSAQKIIHKRFSKDEIFELFRTLKQRIPGFNIHITLIPGLPFETREEFLNNFAMLAENPDIDNISSTPLMLRSEEGSEKFSPSEFSLNAEKYGYVTRFDEELDEMYWENHTNGMNFKEAIELAYYVKQTVISTFPKQRAPGFFIFHDQFFRTNADGIKFHSFIEKYKEKLLSRAECNK